MSRISIEVTPQEHKRLKALAALRGKSIKEFVLDCTIGAYGAEDALALLESFLDRRLAEGVSERSVSEIFDAARSDNDSPRDG